MKSAKVAEVFFRLKNLSAGRAPCESFEDANDMPTAMTAREGGGAIHWRRLKRGFQEGLFRPLRANIWYLYSNVYIYIDVSPQVPIYKAISGGIVYIYTWWVFQIFFCFHLEKLGKWSNLTSIFFRWVVQPPTSLNLQIFYKMTPSAVADILDLADGWIWYDMM